MANLYAKRVLAYLPARSLSICLLFTFLFSSRSAFTQVAPYSTRDFLNNVVEIGLSDFGLITGEDSTHLYFIAVRSAGARSADILKNVKLYNASYRARATRIDSKRIGAFQVVIYQTLKPPVGEWKKEFYQSFAFKRGTLSTFRDKWMSDKIWSILSAKMNVTKQGKEGVVTIRVPREAGIAKGMPLINSEGFIAGVAAESSLGKTNILAINMKEIALAIAGIDNSCKYFNMVEFGHTDNRCVEQALFAALQKAKQDSLQHLKDLKTVVTPPPPADTTSSTTKSEKKKHFIDYGINANFLAGPSQVPINLKDYDSETRVVQVGISVHLNITKSGQRRLTLKPRYGNFKEVNEPGLWIDPSGNLKVTKSSYQYVEMPIIFEQRILKSKKYSMAIGAGYSPGMIFSHSYRLQDKTSPVTSESSNAIAGKTWQHRLVGELYFYEFSFGRLGAVYMKDITSYPHADHVMSNAGTDYKPFADRKKGWYIGIEAGVRLRGRW